MSRLRTCAFCQTITLCFHRRNHFICVECALHHRDEAA